MCRECETYKSASIYQGRLGANDEYQSISELTPNAHIYYIRTSTVPRVSIIWLACAVKVERSSTARLHLDRERVLNEK
jgi:hypothetical protein